MNSIALKRIALGFISKLPIWPPSFVMAKTLNQALKPVVDDGSLAVLNGKMVMVLGKDLGFLFSFTMKNNLFLPLNEVLQSDLRIRADLYDFYLLATRQEDPDTLFFNRRLEIEGDTELGLVVKNALDSMELPQSVNSICNLIKEIAVNLKPSQ